MRLAKRLGDLAEQRERALGLFRVDHAQREADMHDHVIAWARVGHERERNRLAHAPEIDDARFGVGPFDEPCGNG